MPRQGGIQGYMMSWTVASVHSAFLACGSHITASQRKGTTGTPYLCLQPYQSDLPYGLQVEAALIHRGIGSSHKDFMGEEGLLLWRKKPRVSGQFYSDGNLVGARQAPLSLLSSLKRLLESRVSLSRPYHVTVYNSSRSFLQIW